MSKPDKESKKPEKERGEIEVRIEFSVKPKAGSILDLSKSFNECFNCIDYGHNFK